MVRAKNYKTASSFVEVIQRKLLASFFPDTEILIEIRYFRTKRHTHLEFNSSTEGHIVVCQCLLKILE